ncbi:MAG TPA: ATP-binding protein [Longimicrobiales bacterium]
MATDSAPSADGARRRVALARAAPAGLLWIAVVTAVTAGLVALRGALDKAHIALVYLLVVLAASAGRGRRVGIALAILCFICFEVFLLPPYHGLALQAPADWLVLAAFLTTSVVAAQLLDRARREAAAAQRRAQEIEHLSRLGAETLNAGRAEDAVEAAARVIRSTLSVGWCGIHQREPETGAFRLVGAAARPDFDPASEAWTDAILAYVVEHRAAAVRRLDGAVHVVGVGEEAAGAVALAQPDARSMLLPLGVRGSVVGVLALADDRPILLDAAQQRFVDALGYYAALAVERVRLAAEAEHAEALRHADRLKDALLAAVSHDLRTPLTTIKALAHEIRERGDERAAIVEVEADRLNRLVADLLDLSRLQAGALPLDPELHAADDLLGAALDRLAGTPRVGDVRVELDAAEPLIGRFDFVHSLRALVNLIENALKYSPAGSPVEVVARREGDDVVFSVLDRGAGIPASAVDRIFEPFFRGPGVAPDTAGAGLGLAIARRLAEAQGGTIRYAPRPGGGSIFSLHLPAADAASVCAPSS